MEKILAAAGGLPEVEQGTSYGTPALKVRDKLLCRVKDGQTIVIVCPIEEKEHLIASAPDLYFETAHYRDWPALLVRIDAISVDELALRLRRAFIMQAPKRLAARLAAR